MTWINLNKSVPWLALHRKCLLLEQILHLEPLNFFLGAIVLVKDVRRLILGESHLSSACLKDPVGDCSESHTSKEEALKGAPQGVCSHEAKTDRDERHREKMVNNFGSEIVLVMMAQKLSDKVV